MNLTYKDSLLHMAMDRDVQVLDAWHQVVLPHKNAVSGGVYTNYILLKNGELINYNMGCTYRKGGKFSAISGANKYDSNGKLLPHNTGMRVLYSVVGDAILALRCAVQKWWRADGAFKIDGNKMHAAYSIIAEHGDKMTTIIPFARNTVKCHIPFTSGETGMYIDTANMHNSWIQMAGKQVDFRMIEGEIIQNLMQNVLAARKKERLKD